MRRLSGRPTDSRSPVTAWNQQSQPVRVVGEADRRQARGDSVATRSSLGLLEGHGSGLRSATSLARPDGTVLWNA